MFSLIITIISIALVAALALATLYYGGTAFNRGAAGAAAARLINEGQQINGAVALYRADFASGATTTVATSLATLPAGYLASVPTGWTSANVNAGTMAHADTTSAVCVEVLARVGTTAMVTCAEAVLGTPPFVMSYAL